jgi:hypothetical protein
MIPVMSPAAVLREVPWAIPSRTSERLFFDIGMILANTLGGTAPRVLAFF